MNDRPSAVELIAAVRQFLEGELMPTLTDPRLRFQTLIAANVLSIADRELKNEEDDLRADWEWLAPLLGLTRPAALQLSALKQEVRDANLLLCQRIRTGSFDEPAAFRRLAAQVHQSVQRKLAITNPGFGKG